MPHKRNPVLSENLTGLARMVRAYVMPAMENVVLWHERDISHSSVERMIGPDATVTLDFALNRLAGHDRPAGGLSGEHAAQPRPPRRPRAFPARAARAHPEGLAARGRLPPGPAQRHEGVAGERRFPENCWRPTRTCGNIFRKPRSRRMSISDIISRKSTRSSPGCSGPREGHKPWQNLPTILVFDSGLGGLTVFREIVKARPDASYVYVADDAFFPYGSHGEAQLVCARRAADGGADRRPCARPRSDRLQHRVHPGAAHLRARLAVPFVGHRAGPSSRPAWRRARGWFQCSVPRPTVQREYTAP